MITVNEEAAKALAEALGASGWLRLVCFWHIWCER